MVQTDTKMFLPPMPIKKNSASKFNISAIWVKREIWWDVLAVFNKCMVLLISVLQLISIRWSASSNQMPPLWCQCTPPSPSLLQGCCSSNRGVMVRLYVLTVNRVFCSNVQSVLFTCPLVFCAGFWAPSSFPCLCRRPGPGGDGQSAQLRPSACCAQEDRAEWTPV